MIISCPQCDTRFVVPSTVFRNGPRKMRCSSCKHKWEQDKPDDGDDLSQYISKNQKKDTEAESDGKQSILSKIKNDFIKGYVVIIAMVVLVIGGYFGYKALFMPSIIMGQGLAFDNVQIQRADEMVTVTGDIVNAMDSDRGVPPIEIMMILANNVKGDSIIVTPEKELLHSGENISFEIQLDQVGAEVLNVHVGFKTPHQQKSLEKENNSDDDHDESTDKKHEDEEHH